MLEPPVFVRPACRSDMRGMWEVRPGAGSTPARTVTPMLESRPMLPSSPLHRTLAALARMCDIARPGMRAIGVIALAANALCACTTPAGRDDSPTSTVSDFSRWYLASAAGGFPPSDTWPALRALVTPAFYAALEKGHAGMECHRSATQGTEPPPLAGDLFVSLFEGATSLVSLAVVSRTRDQAVVGATWRYHVSSPGQPPVQWTDRVMLKQVDGKWLIDDFMHDGTWAFAVKGSVTQVLMEVAKECAR